MPDEDKLGKVVEDVGRLGLRYERTLAHPPEKVLRALTESRHLRHWMPCDLLGERRAGATLSARFWPDFVEKYTIDQPDLPAKILVWDPPRVFEWSWDTDVLRFELEPVPAGTRLVFVTWPDAAERVPFHKTGAGYHTCLDHLEEWLDVEKIETPLLHARVEPLEAAYQALLAAASASIKTRT